MATKRMTQEDMVLRHLNDCGFITTWDAYAEYGITRLSAKIYNLRRQGYNIISKTKTTTNRYGANVNYSEYFLSIYRCLRCDHGDTNDFPNFFCELNGNLLDVTAEITCPLDEKEGAKK